MFFPLQATRVSHSWIFLFGFLLLIDKVSLGSVSVVGVAGGTVLLPCRIEGNLPFVYWRYKNSKNVCDLVNTEVDFVEQDAAYNGRVSHFPSEIRNGNFSIHLHKVSKSDEGLYECGTPTGSMKVSLQLTVTENKEEQQAKKRPNMTEALTPMSAPSSGQTARRADRLFTLLLGSALLYSATF